MGRADDASLFPTFVARFSLACSERELARHPLLAEVELDPSLDDARTSRKHEFLAGRACAREALRRLALGPTPAIPIGVRGAPIWPAGIVGSISHTQGLVSAAVCSSLKAAGIGLDVQRWLRPDELAAFNVVATNEEAARAQSRLQLSALATRTLLFSAKESVFKCLYPLTGLKLRFEDVELDVQAASTETKGAFLVRLSCARPENTSHELILSGRFVLDREHVQTGVWCRAL